jgi:hypothetical protein
MADNTKVKAGPVNEKPPRRKPVPIPNRMSNSDIQQLIDATLDIRILGDKKLRDCTRADLLRSAEQDKKDANALSASAASKRAMGRRLSKLRKS